MQNNIKLRKQGASDQKYLPVKILITLMVHYILQHTKLSRNKKSTNPNLLALAVQIELSVICLKLRIVKYHTNFKCHL